MAEIVVGIDDSEPARAALRWAVEEAQLRKASVVALHAWEQPLIPGEVGLSPEPPLDYAAILEELRDAGQALVEQVVRDAVGEDPPVSVELLAVEGPPASALLDAAELAVLLVVGSRGRGGFSDLLLGSTSHQVAMHAPCPVVIHR
jgi:nucleotide-binding universal stress UspA family protein